MSIEDLNDPDELRNSLRTQMVQASQETRRELGPSPSPGSIDPETVQTLVDEAQKMRETAENIEQQLH